MATLYWIEPLSLYFPPLGELPMIMRICEGGGGELV